jgi:hypothetical protein
MQNSLESSSKKLPKLFFSYTRIITFVLPVLGYIDCYAHQILV